MKNKLECYRVLVEGGTLVNKNGTTLTMVNGEQRTVSTKGLSMGTSVVFYEPNDWSIQPDPIPSKKAYAYKHNSGQLVFYPTIQDKGSIINLPFTREPDYDIDYELEIK